MSTPEPGRHRILDVAGPAGRTLRVIDDGGPGDPRLPLFVHHGTPASGLLPEPALADARQHGLRMIGYDRPGYGGSTRQRGRQVADAAADVACVADALGIDRFATWGLSGGGPHALACAAQLPGRCVAAASLAGVAPYPASGLDWTAGMGADNVEEFAAALAGPQALHPLLAAARDEMLASSAETLVELMASLLPAVDVAALTSPGETGPGLGDWMHTGTIAGLAPGHDGWLDDDLAFLAPWGLDLSTVTVPVLIMAGGADLMVPFAHGRWLAENVPNAERLFDEDEGHLSLLNRIGEVHTWIGRVTT
jgi:pimeloyl-ACP methyl ester carboxylesterase